MKKLTVKTAISSLLVLLLVTAPCFGMGTQALTSVQISEKILNGENVVQIEDAWEQAVSNGAFVGATPKTSMQFTQKGLQVPISSDGYISHLACIYEGILPQQNTLYKAQITIAKENFADTSAIITSSGSMVGANPQIYFYRNQADAAAFSANKWSVPDAANCISWDFDAEGHLYYSLKGATSGANPVCVTASDGSKIDFRTDENAENARFTLTIYYISNGVDSARSDGNLQYCRAYITRGNRSVETAIMEDNTLAAAGNAKQNCSVLFNLSGGANDTDRPTLAFRMSRTDGVTPPASFKNHLLMKEQAVKDTYIEDIRLSFLNNPEMAGATVKVADAANQNLRFTANYSGRSADCKNYFFVNQGMILIASEKNTNNVPLRAYHTLQRYGEYKYTINKYALTEQAKVVNTNTKVHLCSNIFGRDAAALEADTAAPVDTLHADIMQSGIASGNMSEYVGTRVMARAFLQYAICIPDSAASGSEIKYTAYLKTAYSHNNLSPKDVTNGRSDRSVMGVTKSIAGYVVGKMGSAFDPTDSAAYITISGVPYSRKDIAYILNNGYYADSDSKGTQAQQRELMLEFINQTTEYNDK